MAKKPRVHYRTSANESLTIDQALEDKSSKLFVINNVLAVNKMRGSVVLAVQRRGTDRTSTVSIVETWLPQDLSRRAPKADLLEDPQFRSLVESGALYIISAERAAQILATAQAADEIAYLNRDKAAEAAADAVTDIEVNAPADGMPSNDAGQEEISVVDLPYPNGPGSADLTAGKPVSASQRASKAPRTMTEDLLERFAGGQIDVEVVASTIVNYGASGILTAEEVVRLQDRLLPARLHRALEQVLAAKSKGNGKPTTPAAKRQPLFAGPNRGGPIRG